MVKLSDIELPMIFKNRLLFSHGILNNWHIHATEVTKSLDMTDWSDQKNRALYLSHTSRDAQKWVGRIANPYTKDGELYGDLEIMDADLALKLGPGKAPLGVSAEIKWPKQYADPTDFSYRSFAMVPNPEVPETMVNFSEEESNDEDYKTAKLHVPFKVSTTNFSEEEEEVEETKEVVEEAKADLDETKEDLMSAERGFEKEMENNANDVVPEVKEEVMETKVEEVVEEVEEEANAEFSKLEAKFDALQVKVNELTESFAKFSESAEAETEEEVVEEVKEEVAEEAPEVVEEAKAEFNEEEVEEVVEEPKEEVTEEVEEVKEEEANAEFSELASKIDKLADAISKKEAAPMSTAEFGSNGDDKGSAVIDRLTKSLEN